MMKINLSVAVMAAVVVFGLSGYSHAVAIKIPAASKQAMSPGGQGPVQGVYNSSFATANNNAIAKAAAIEGATLNPTPKQVVSTSQKPTIEAIAASSGHDSNVAKSEPIQTPAKIAEADSTSPQYRNPVTGQSVRLPNYNPNKAVEDAGNKQAQEIADEAYRTGRDPVTGQVLPINNNSQTSIWIRYIKPFLWKLAKKVSGEIRDNGMVISAPTIR